MFSHKVIPMVFPVDKGVEGFQAALEKMLAEAENAVDTKRNYIILSDRNISEGHAPFPSLLAVAAVHHHLIKKQKRMQVGLLLKPANPAKCIILHCFWVTEPA
jgi:glutamate synthase (NADPH) large chain